MVRPLDSISSVFWLSLRSTTGGPGCLGTGDFSTTLTLRATTESDCSPTLVALSTSVKRVTVSEDADKLGS